MRCFSPTYQTSSKIKFKGIKRLLLLFITIPFCSEAQQPRLNFLPDSAGIAEDILVTLSFDHSAVEDVFFPKGASYFKPFELINSTYFTTKTIDSISTDSVLYILRSFEVDTLKSLKLPIWIVKGEDSTIFWSNTDSLFFSDIIPDSLLAKTDLVYGLSFVKKGEVKIPIGLKVLLACLIVLGLLVLAFLDKIRRLLDLWNFQKRQNEFNERFKKIIKDDTSSEELKEASTLWRDHMTWLERLPFNTLSSVEIETTAKDKKVGEAIREIESSLFGGVDSDRIPVALQILFSYNKERFKEKRIEYKKRISKRH